eukprot:1497332-Rhodomonas_salina.3
MPCRFGRGLRVTPSWRVMSRGGVLLGGSGLTAEDVGHSREARYAPREPEPWWSESIPDTPPRLMIANLNRGTL